MRREKFEAAIFICVVLCAVAAPVWAEEPTAEPEPKRAVTIDAAFKAADNNHNQVVVSVTKTAVKKKDDGEIFGAAIQGSGSFVTEIKPEAMDKSIILPTANAALEVYAGKGTSRYASSDERTVVGVVRVSASRDIGLGERWSTLAAVGVQVGMGEHHSSPLGTLGRLPVQPGFSGNASFMFEGGVANMQMQGDKVVGVANAKLQEAVQYCLSLSKGNRANDLLCAGLIASQVLGTHMGSGLEVSLMYAHKIEEGGQKGYFFIAPSASTSGLAPSGRSDLEIRNNQLGGRVGIIF